MKLKINIILISFPLLAINLERPDGSILKAFFTPHDNLEEQLCAHIANEQKEICIMVYYITDPFIIDALKKAQKRDVKVTIIIDYWWATHNKNSLEKHTSDIQIHACKPLKGGVMHHKFVLFKSNLRNKPLIWSGSFNLSKRSQSSNDENIIVSNDIELYQQYEKIFDESKERATSLAHVPYKPKTRKENLKIRVKNVK
ncbi:TPA: hypothetical protein DIC20_05085 [Candidatus Dependentiae bacterium]|nr:hypothetical protein [Candidatus Dependentiae bacterium]HCU01045.1 hypothetical protein [Candidatus Dependentiae bacterium]